jgi:hypothetical protein
MRVIQCSPCNFRLDQESNLRAENRCAVFHPQKQLPAAAMTAKRPDLALKLGEFDAVEEALNRKARRNSPSVKIRGFGRAYTVIGA